MSGDITEQIGYIKRATEDNTFQIRRFYDLLDRHMEGEDQRTEAIDRRLNLLTFLMVFALGSELPWKDLLAYVKVFL